MQKSSYSKSWEQSLGQLMPDGSLVIVPRVVDTVRLLWCGVVYVGQSLGSSIVHA